MLFSFIFFLKLHMQIVIGDIFESIVDRFLMFIQLYIYTLWT